MRRKEIGVSNISAHLQPIFVNNRFFSRYCPLELAERSRIFADRAFADTTPALLTSCYYSPVKIPDLFVDLPILITLYFSPSPSSSYITHQTINFFRFSALVPFHFSIYIPLHPRPLPPIFPPRSLFSIRLKKIKNASYK